MPQLTAVHSLLSSFDGPEPSSAPAWLAHLRQAGADQFESLGLPTVHDEEWRQTNVSVLGKTEFALAQDNHAKPFDISRFEIPQLEAYKLVFVDGQFSSELSDIGEVPPGITIKRLSQAIESDDKQISAYLGKSAKIHGDAFVSLNTAYLDDGAFIQIPDNTSLDKPVHLLFASTSGSGAALMSHPRVLFVIGENAQGQVIEQHVGEGDDLYFSNSVAEIFLSKDARATHSFIERDSPAAYNISTLAIEQEQGSDFRSHSILLGGKLVRNNINPTFTGEHCHSLLNGLYLPVEGKHMDSHMRVHHTAPNCDSRQYYTGVLSGKSSGAFIGRILVDQIAQKTDAVQSSRGLLLSDNAYLHNRPQLEIFADDVKCTHGATIGELDKESLFYLESRGISKDQAQSILITAFANETLERIENQPLRDELTKLLAGQLALGGN